MNCPICDIDMRVNADGIEIEHDDTPDQPTMVYSVQTFTCRNKQCSNYDRVVARIRHPLN